MPPHGPDTPFLWRAANPRLGAVSPLDPSLRLADAPPAPELVARVDEVLRSGGVAALPTETVYGLAARADDPRAVAALVQLKNKPAGSPLTWHVGRREALADFPRIPPTVRRLVERYWPGPLTLVLPGVPAGLGPIADDGWTGIRFPAHRGTAELLAQLDYPVAMTSANEHNEAPASDAAEVERVFEGRVALVVDGGAARLGESSAVLRLGEGRFELLREGLVSPADLRRTAGLRIAFVCTGNTCRSPMAEGLAVRLIAERLGWKPERGDPREHLALFGFEVSSMGVAAGHGGPPASHAVDVLRSAGMDISGHRSQPVIPERVATLDRIYCLTASHRAMLLGVLPPSAGERVELLDPEGSDVPDPIGGGPEVYRACAEAIAGFLKSRLGDWA